jgi:DNA polymerase III epsilon subunit-like protein
MLACNSFLVIDTETTGLDPTEHRVVEVAAVLVVGGRIVSAFTSYVNPGRSIPPETSAVHGLVDADVVDAPTLQELMPRLNRLCEEVDVIVAHNAPFDRSMLPGLIEKPWLDTLRLAQHLYPDFESHKNGVLRYALGLKCPEANGMPAHRALSDSYVTS